MFRKIDINKRLPEVGKYVTTIDVAGNHRVYQYVGNGWNLRDASTADSPPDNLPITHWLEEVELNSGAIIGEVASRFQELARYNLNWSSFYDGWLEGRTDLASVAYDQKSITP
jgi:hypothetical protein